MPEGKNRTFGLNHGAGKGDACRVTDVKAYRENFESIDWSKPQPNERPLKTLREIIHADDTAEFMNCL